MCCARKAWAAVRWCVRVLAMRKWPAVFYVVDVRGQEALHLGVSQDLYFTNVAEPTSLFEPEAKLGGAILHSCVIAVANHSSVCGLKNMETRSDKSSHGIWQVCSC